MSSDRLSFLSSSSSLLSYNSSSESASPPNRFRIVSRLNSYYQGSFLQRIAQAIFSFLERIFSTPQQQTDKCSGVHALIQDYLPAIQDILACPELLGPEQTCSAYDKKYSSMLKKYAKNNGLKQKNYGFPTSKATKIIKSYIDNYLLCKNDFLERKMNIPPSHRLSELGKEMFSNIIKCTQKIINKSRLNISKDELFEAIKPNIQLESKSIEQKFKHIIRECNQSSSEQDIEDVALCLTLHNERFFTNIYGNSLFKGTKENLKLINFPLFAHEALTTHEETLPSNA